MFEQMVNDCAREASFRKLDSKQTTKGLLPSILEALGR